MVETGGEEELTRAQHQGADDVEEYCGHCGTRLVPRANFCHHCGAQVLRPDTQIITPPPPVEARRPPRDESLNDELGPLPPTDGIPEETEESERLVWQGRPSFKAILIGLVSGAVMATALVGSVHWILLRSDNRVPKPETELAVWVSVVVVFTLRPLYRVLARRYRVTTRSIWVEEGLVRRIVTRYRLADWRHIHLHQSLLQRLVGTGHIELESNDRTEAPIFFLDIDRARDVVELLDRALAVARPRQTVHARGSASRRRPSQRAEV